MSDDDESKDGQRTWAAYCDMRSSSRDRTVPTDFGKDSYKPHSQSLYPDPYYHDSRPPHHEAYCNVEFTSLPDVFSTLSVGPERASRISSSRCEWNTSVSTIPSLCESELSGDYSEPSLCHSPHSGPHNNINSQQYLLPTAYGHRAGELYPESLWRNDVHSFHPLQQIPAPPPLYQARDIPPYSSLPCTPPYYQNRRHPNLPSGDSYWSDDTQYRTWPVSSHSARLQSTSANEYQRDWESTRSKHNSVQRPKMVEITTGVSVPLRGADEVRILAGVNSDTFPEIECRISPFAVGIHQTILLL
jgi:hypothetical protein